MENLFAKYNLQLDISQFTSTLRQATQSLNNVNVSGLQQGVSGLQQGYQAANNAAQSHVRVTRRIGDTYVGMEGGAKGAMMGIGTEIAHQLGGKAKAAIKDIMQLETAFKASTNQIQATLGVLDKETMTPLIDKIKDLGATTNFSAKQVADGANVLAMSGSSMNEIQGALEGVLTVAAAGGISIEKSAGLLTGTAKSMGMSVKDDMMKIGDVVAYTAAKANVDLTTMASTFQNAAPVVSNFGINVEGLSSLTGILGNINIKSGKAGTSIKSMFTSMAKNMSKFKGLANQVGVDMSGIVDNTGKFISEVDKSTGKTVNVGLIRFQETLKKMEAEGTKQGLNMTTKLTSVFGERGIMTVNALKGYQGDFGQFLKEIGSASEGSAEQMKNTQLQGIVGAKANLESAMEGAKLAIGSVLEPLFVMIIKIKTAILSWFTKLSPTTHKFMAGILIVIAVLGSLAGAFFIVNGLIGVFSGAMMAAIMPIIIAAAPIIAIVAAIGLVIYALYEFGKHPDKIKAKFKKAIEAIKKFFMELPPKLAEVGLQILVIVARIIWNVLKGVYNLVKTIIKVLWDMIKYVWKMIWNFLTVTVPKFFSGLWTTVVNAFLNIIKTLKKIFHGFVSFFASIFKNGFFNTLITLKNAFKEWLHGLWTGIGTWIKGVVNSLKAIGTKIKDLLTGKITVKEMLGITSKEKQTPLEKLSIDEYANGGDNEFNVNMAGMPPSMVSLSQPTLEKLPNMMPPQPPINVNTKNDIKVTNQDDKTKISVFADYVKNGRPIGDKFEYKTRS